MLRTIPRRGGTIRRHHALAFIATLVLLTGPGRATGGNIPSPPTSIIPGLIRLVGTDPSGHPDPSGVFTITVRDLAMNPVPWAYVVLDFTNATDLRPCAVQGPGVVMLPEGPRGVTDANGQVTMTLLGHALAYAPASPPSSIRIFANGVYLGAASGAAFDLDGAGGVGGADLALFLADFVGSSNPARCDYDGNGAVTGGDFSIWLRVFIGGTSTQTCPPVVTAPN